MGNRERRRFLDLFLLFIYIIFFVGVWELLWTYCNGLNVDGIKFGNGMFVRLCECSHLSLTKTRKRCVGY